MGSSSKDKRDKKFIPKLIPNSPPKELTIEEKKKLIKQINARRKKIANRKHYYIFATIVKRLTFISLKHNCKEAINLVGSVLRVDTRVYVRCSICGKRFPLSLDNKAIKK